MFSIFLLTNLFQLNNQTDKMVLKFDNGVMIQAFRITELQFDNTSRLINFPESFFNDNIYMASCGYHISSNEKNIEMGPVSKTQFKIFCPTGYSISAVRPYGIYVIAIGMWK